MNFINIPEVKDSSTWNIITAILLVVIFLIIVYLMYRSYANQSELEEIWNRFLDEIQYNENLSCSVSEHKSSEEKVQTRSPTRVIQAPKFVTTTKNQRYREKPTPKWVDTGEQSTSIPASTYLEQVKNKKSLSTPKKVERHKDHEVTSITSREVIRSPSLTRKVQMKNFK